MTTTSKTGVLQYLREDGHGIGLLLSKLKQLRQWNEWLKDCLPHEPSLFQHCQIVGLSGQSLIVIADSAHWVTRLRFYIPELLPKLRVHEELKKLKSICCKVQPNDFSAKAKKIKRPPQVLSEKNARLLATTAETLSDKKLRAVLEKIAGNQ